MIRQWISFLHTTTENKAFVILGSTMDPQLDPQNIS